jgi:two-component system osmolarity sensor histidine kinase EnvZ
MQPFSFQSYFWKILFTIGVVSIGFLVIMLSTLAYYMVIPLGHRATDDLASVMTHAAERWGSLPAAERGVFIEKMQQKHDLVLTSADTPLPDSTNLLPYLLFLEASLNNQLDEDTRLKTSTDKNGEEWFWTDIPVSDEILRIGFSRSRIGVKPPAAFFILLLTGVYLTFITAVILTRRLTAHIDKLYLAAKSIGKGQWPDPIEEEGPEELVVLAREFNRMSIQVRELLANRTTLLAGIAHDLRTPLTQVQLALAMLPNDGGDPGLMESIRSDLEQINNLIAETLSISLELVEEREELTDIGPVLGKIVKSLQKDGVEIEYSCNKPCCQITYPLALRRILTNLLENAVRYGEGEPVQIACACENNANVIRIMDRGPGIPREQKEAVFRPFHRLEASRGSSTGGSGLGLAIVRQLANAHAWTVQLKPRPGGGTIAELSMPCS